MNKQQIKKLARECLNLGPAIAIDEKGNDYWAYVLYIRIGMKFKLVCIDEDIINFYVWPDGKLEFIIREIEHVLKSMPTSPERMVA